MGGSNLLVALAGQPNCGKSTVFNMLTGARQHVANYPGVTVEKKSGAFDIDELRVEIVDLPGTYSLSSYSLEERVTRDFLINDSPEIVLDVIDASNLKRNLYLTLQILEMELPTVLNLNMMDVADRRDHCIDIEKLGQLLRSPVVVSTAKKGTGSEGIRQAIADLSESDEKPEFQIDYGVLEEYIPELMDLLKRNPVLSAQYPVRWLAIKLLEGDLEALNLLRENHADWQVVADKTELIKAEASRVIGKSLDRYISFTRHAACAGIARQVVTLPSEKHQSVSEIADKYVCGRLTGPLILVAVLFTLYQISIVFGGWLAQEVWPLWAELEQSSLDLLPHAGFMTDPLLRSLLIWELKSVTSILNYLPIFFLLFALIAILEDSGYMPRMAFILDRVFKRFGLHGQSTLPMILGGIYVGGCAIPGVVSTKAIPDERARLATILIIPMMNCLAKVPLYLILISAYFSDVGGLAMFFIATVTLFMALPVAKLLSMTVLRNCESAPFLMEMPPYHLPTLTGVLRRALERIWLFMKKIITVVAAVAVVVFVLINFPGISKERMAAYEERRNAAVDTFIDEVNKTKFRNFITSENVIDLILFSENFKSAKSGAADQLQAMEISKTFETMNPAFYSVVRRVGDEGKLLNRHFKKLVHTRKSLRRELRAARFESSFLGTMGRALEPLTQFAGFNWKINIALLSAFAAKENSAATLGSIYGIDDSGQSVQESMKAGESGFTSLHALALMLFMALYPPCVPTSIMVRHQTNSTKWMLFSIGYQTLLGISVASLVFTGGNLLGLTGFQAMWGFYALCVAATLIMALIPTPDEKAAKEISSTNTVQENCS